MRNVVRDRVQEGGGNRTRRLAAAAIAAVLVFGVGVVVMRRLEAGARNPAWLAAQIDEAGRLRPVAEVARMLRRTQLVTVEIRSRVTAEILNESWRGDVTATVEAPVRLLYGTDLSAIGERGGAWLSPISREYVLRIPPPTRLAAEVMTEDESPRVSVGWLRFRTWSGEYFLGQARRVLHERACEMVQSAEQAEEVRRATREQVTKLVRGLVGPGREVVVVFEDEP